MKLKVRSKEMNSKVYIIPIIIITLTLVVIGYFVISGIRNYYYNHMREDSIKLARNYSLSISKATEADEIINGLLTEKIMIALEMASGVEYSDESFIALAEKLCVDEIDYYDASGVIVYSNIDDIIGWDLRKYESHPIKDFLSSGKLKYVGEIRQDYASGKYFKYGYMKVGTGDSLIQVGVKAENIYSFLDRFAMDSLLEEMFNSEVAIRISIIDKNFKVVGSTDENYLDTIIKDKDVIKSINNNKDFGIIREINDEKVYEVFVPIFYEGEKLGTLSIVEDLRETEAVVFRVSALGILFVTIIYISLLFIIYYSYKKDTNLIYIAYNDILTGLPNLLYIKKNLPNDIENNKDKLKAILLINCSDFKVINMIYGFDFGDELLKELSDIIKGLADDNKMPFRFSGDRFGLYIKNYYTKENLIELINTIKTLCREPFSNKDATQYMDFRVGIVEFINPKINVDHLLREALVALNNLNENDNVCYSFFNEEMEKKLQRVEAIEKELRNILLDNTNKSLYLDYQPLVELKTNKIVGFEALARLKTDSLGQVSPSEFIEVAERKQLIVPLGNLILKMACEFINKISKKGFTNIKVAVNISGIQLLRENFIYDVRKIIKDANIDKSLLELEITESTILDNYDYVNRKLSRLRNNNISIALDDFGTGYSSFYRLKNLNIDILKIDRYFINSLSDKNNKKLMTGSIIDMAHKLGLVVVAEGVEKEEQKAYLIQHNCDIMQGFLFSKPLSEEDAYNLLIMRNK